MKFKDSDTAIKIQKAAIPFLEKLGVCVAAFVGGGAIAKYAVKVFPLLPLAPFVIGSLLILVSIVLALLVVYEAWRVLTASIHRPWLIWLILLGLLVPSVFFVLAGGLAAVDALPAP